MRSCVAIRYQARSRCPLHSSSGVSGSSAAAATGPHGSPSECALETRFTVAAAIFVLSCALAVSASAQQGGVLPGDDRLETPPFRPPAPSPGFELPPPPPLAEEERDRLSSGRRGYVRTIRVEGSSVFSPEELAAVVAPFEDRLLASEDLYRARDAVSALYQEAGYLTSGAVLPDQEVVDGVVVLRVVEGRLAEIEIEGLRSFHESYLRSRLEWAARAPVNVWRLERALQLLQQNQLIEKVSARLLPGDARGESRLELEVDEALPIRLELAASNYRSVGVGEFTGEADGSLSNVYGLGDELRFVYEVTEGLDDYEFSYSIPVNRFDTLFSIRWRDSRGDIVLDEFDPLDIRSRVWTLGFTLEQPLFRTFGREFRIGVTGEVRESTTKVDDSDFCTIVGNVESGPGGSTVVVGAPDCDPRVAALRVFQQLTLSGQRSALALRSSVTFGLDTLGATKNTSDVADGDFVAWLAQLQLVYRLPPVLLESELVGRVDGQIASSPLLAIEKFSVGGARTVRGYRENQIVRDNGVAASLELRIPLLRDRQRKIDVSLLPFVDVGYGRDDNGPGKLRSDTLASVGTGLGFELFDAIRGEIYYGGRLTGAPGENGDGIQRHGVHFRVAVDTLAFWR